MENKQAPLILVIILSLAAYSYIKYSECQALVTSLEQVDAGYRDFMSKTINKKPLFEYIRHDSIGVFQLKGASYACAQVITVIPTRSPKK